MTLNYQSVRNRSGSDTSMSTASGWQPSRRAMYFGLGAAAMIGLVVLGTAHTTSDAAFLPANWRANSVAMEMEGRFPFGASPGRLRNIWRDASFSRLYPTEVFNSQCGQDAFAEHFFFKDVKHGTYLELGGNDGLDNSNTFHFERNAGWRGILIEVDPLNYAKMEINRQRDVTVHAAVCKDERQLRLIQANGDRTLAGIYDFMSDSFLNQFYPNLQQTGLDAVTTGFVPCLPLDRILQYIDRGLTHINFMSLDVEGAELSVLESIDFNRVKFDAMVIETNHTPPERMTAMIDLLASNGYRVFKRDVPESVFEKVPRGRNCAADQDTWFVHESVVLSE